MTKSYHWLASSASRLAITLFAMVMSTAVCAQDGTRTATQSELRQLETLYRADMDGKRFLEAQKQTLRLTELQPSSALAWYRRARASAFSSQWEDAKMALNRAKELDPKINFSADPARVKALDKLIEVELTERLPTSPAAAAEPVVAQLPLPTGTPISDPLVATQSMAIAQTATKAPALREQPTEPAVMGVALDMPWWAIALIALTGVAVVGGGLMGLLIALANRRELSNARLEFKDFITGLRTIYDKQAHIHKLADVFEGMTRSQRELHLLRQLLMKESLKDTAIYDAIEGFLPVLERNIGLAGLQELEIKGINAGLATTAEIGQKLFQMHQTGRYTVAVSARAGL